MCRTCRRPTRAKSRPTRPPQRAKATVPHAADKKAVLRHPGCACPEPPQGSSRVRHKLPSAAAGTSSSGIHARPPRPQSPKRQSLAAPSWRQGGGAARRRRRPHGPNCRTGRAERAPAAFRQASVLGVRRGHPWPAAAPLPRASMPAVRLRRQGTAQRPGAASPVAGEICRHTANPAAAPTAPESPRRPLGHGHRARHGGRRRARHGGRRRARHGGRRRARHGGRRHSRNAGRRPANTSHFSAAGRMLLSFARSVRPPAGSSTTHTSDRTARFGESSEPSALT